MIVEGSLDTDGFAVARALLSPLDVDRLRESLPHGVRGGVRNLLDLEAVRELARSIGGKLGPSYFAVRGILFDKSMAANWKVPWHQDLAIAVAGRAAISGYTGWSVKAGVPHVQPPVEILESMIAARVHLDDTLVGDGELRLIPGSHVCGRLSITRIERWRNRGPVAAPELRAGDALLMRPLTLHSSSVSASGRPRRVVHLEFADRELPDGLQWHQRISHAEIFGHC